MAAVEVNSHPALARSPRNCNMNRVDSIRSKIFRIADRISLPDNKNMASYAGVPKDRPVHCDNPVNVISAPYS